MSSAISAIYTLLWSPSRFGIANSSLLLLSIVRSENLISLKIAVKHRTVTRSPVMFVSVVSVKEFTLSIQFRALARATARSREVQRSMEDD